MQPFCVSLQPPRPVRLVQYWHFVVPRWCEQSTQAPGPHPVATAQRRPRRPPEATPIWAAFSLQKEPTSHSSQRRPPACGMCMPNLPPPCPRSQRRPMGGRRWPLSCGRLASCWGERRSRRSRLHALLRPCGLSPTGIQSVAASRSRRTLCDLHEEAVEKIPLRPGQRPKIQTVVGSPMVIPSQTREK